MDASAFALATAIVAALSGKTEITPGVRLADRYEAPAKEHARVYLEGLLGTVPLDAERHVYGTGQNVYGILPATSGAEQVVVLGAHFDSVRRSPGANDNATGVAVSYQVAVAAASWPCRTRGLIVAFFDEEERGLVGSAQFARWLQAEGHQVHSVHTIDQMGWDQDGDRAIEIELPTTELKALYKRVAAADGMTLHVTSTSSSDHDAFRQRGMAAVGITEEYVNGDTTPHYHRSTDTYDTVNFPYLDRASGFVTKVVKELVTEGCE